ncbi:calcitonin receptor-stimulating peptide 1 [Canis aureus]|eukprot:XP_022263119.1 calcitonin receptor-stimulating peptide 1 isoform X1 [Canis lupus familiaris]
MVLLSVLGYRRKWVTQTIRYCDLSPHWLLRAPGPPAQTQSGGNKSSCWCWEAAEPLLSSRVPATSTVPSPDIGRQHCHSCRRLCSEPPAACRQRSVMGFWKFSPFLVLGILALYQVGFLQAAPFRSALENPPDSGVRNEEELRLLLAAVMKDYMQMKTHELEQEQETEGSRVAVQKRSCNSATCVAHWLGGLLSRAGSVANTNLLPTSMGFKVYNRRRRELKA